MHLKCRFDELDSQTRDYLAEVNKRSGKGTAAISVPGSDATPLVVFLAGVVVGGLMVYYSLYSVKEPIAVAMLQTAGLLIGLWSVAFALRRWLGVFGGYAGHYTVFDPLHIYQVQGEMVRVDSLEAIESVEARGNKDKIVVSFVPAQGRPIRVPIADHASALLVEAYYQSMTELENEPRLGWANASVVELGAAARSKIEANAIPRREEIDLELNRVPESPHKGSRAGWGVFPLLLIVAASVGIFAFCWMSNQGIRDSIAFNDAKDAGVPGLRGYLIDENNVRHREEAKTLISQAYNQPIGTIKSHPHVPAQPELRAAMIALLEELRQSAVAVASIRVETKVPEKSNPLFTTDALRSEVADGLARGIGPELVAFAAAPKETPAHITIVIDQPARPLNAAPAPMEFTISIRPTLESEPTTATLPIRAAIDSPTAPLNAVKQIICTELTGSYKPPPVIVPSDDDF